MLTRSEQKRNQSHSKEGMLMANVRTGSAGIHVVVGSTVNIQIIVVTPSTLLPWVPVEG